MAATRETAFDKAVWAAWDLFQGAGKTSTYDSFLGQAEQGAFAFDMATDEYARYEKVGRALKSLERQSRKWRAAHNLKVEGREIDIPRMVKDLGDTQKRIVQIKKSLEGFLREIPRSDKGHRSEIQDAIKVADMTIRAFQKAQELGVEEAANPSPGRVASRFTQRGQQGSC